MKIIDKTQEVTPRLYTPAELKLGSVYVLYNYPSAELSSRVMFGIYPIDVSSGQKITAVDTAGVAWFDSDPDTYKFQKIEAELTILKQLPE
jgi:hypothetical protein